ncbi:hypothetical protein ACFQAS_01620 [Halopenitus salinus]|uniref:Uncharacterized protein n=1 Tax=Halopenitus salinus TaxID=1198295 RepID=A0ABD5V008_9EURY
MLLHQFIKAQNIREREPNPHVTDEEIREITEDTGLKTNSVVASVGRSKKSLKDVSLFDDGITKYSDLPMTKYRDPEANIHKLRDSGRFDFGINASDNEPEDHSVTVDEDQDDNRNSED